MIDHAAPSRMVTTVLPVNSIGPADIQFVFAGTVTFSATVFLFAFMTPTAS